MNVRLKKIADFCTHSVEFYTAYIGDNDLSEFELFDQKPFPHHENTIDYIYTVIDVMRVRGAFKRYFRNEDAADAMPSVSDSLKFFAPEDFGVRLYCIRLHDELVVLLNGDIKTRQDPTECENVCKHFKNAVKIARKIDKMVIDKELRLTENNCLNELEFEI